MGWRSNTSSAREPYTWPSSPENWFSGVCDHSKVLLQGHQRTVSVDLRLHDAWQYGESRSPVIPRLHCELQTIHHLDQERIALMKNAIGISKDICVARELYLEQLRARLGRSADIRRSQEGRTQLGGVVPVALPDSRTLTREVVEISVKHVFHVTKREVQKWAADVFTNLLPGHI
ncbi:hypothetical protein SCP_0213540 [Sparassis crispa]|uniref:Uncharacterized protein n=1 Tax=Sparassis crispa TaxID=139825 RepID=A0A401GDD9_9APHY|nr:hypothetical protein SCP_0213540 [Sparassis crispa]GBE80151.1 hypothetical protein SCP_0213540 [Sparassis crispa]